MALSLFQEVTLLPSLQCNINQSTKIVSSLKDNVGLVRSAIWTLSEAMRTGGDSCGVCAAVLGTPATRVAIDRLDSNVKVLKLYVRSAPGLIQLFWHEC